MPFNLREGAAGVGRAGWERQSYAGPPPAPAGTACHHGPPLNPHPSPTDPAAPTATCAGHFRFRCLFYSRPERDTRQQRTWRLAQLAGQLGPSVPRGGGGGCRVPLVFTFLIMFLHFPQQAGTVFKQQRPPGGFAGRAASTRPSCDHGAKKTTFLTSSAQAWLAMSPSQRVGTWGVRWRAGKTDVSMCNQNSEWCVRWRSDRSLLGTGGGGAGTLLGATGRTSPGNAG